MEGTGLVRDALLRIRTEYIEMPDLKLTGRQVQRLWNLPPDVSEAALGLLIEEGFLIQAANGAYVRHGTLRPRMEPARAPGIHGMGIKDALLRAS